jgi:dihydropyrimidine dehydrogenase (NAD+) subunit PreA
MNEAAEAAKRGGAKGISAINTVKSIMRINLDTYVSSPAVGNDSAVGGYSGNAIKPIALRYITELGKNPNISGLHISGMGGIETWQDATEFMLLGAGSVQVTTAVMQYGYRIIKDLKAGLNYYLRVIGDNSVKDIVGLALGHVSNTTDSLERDTVVYPKFLRNKCIGCGRCRISCADGGHQAITMKERKPILDPKRCIGCHLCLLVCPAGAIESSGKRVKK